MELALRQISRVEPLARKSRTSPTASSWLTVKRLTRAPLSIRSRRDLVGPRKLVGAQHVAVVGRGARASADVRTGECGCWCRGAVEMRVHDLDVRAVLRGRAPGRTGRRLRAGERVRGRVEPGFDATDGADPVRPAPGERVLVGAVEAVDHRERLDRGDEVGGRRGGLVGERALAVSVDRGHLVVVGRAVRGAAVDVARRRARVVEEAQRPGAQAAVHLVVRDRATPPSKLGAFQAGLRSSSPANAERAVGACGGFWLMLRAPKSSSRPVVPRRPMPAKPTAA